MKKSKVRAKAITRNSKAKVRARAIAVDQRMAKRKHYAKCFSVLILSIIVYLTFLALV